MQILIPTHKSAAALAAQSSPSSFLQGSFPADHPSRQLLPGTNSSSVLYSDRELFVHPESVAAKPLPLSPEAAASLLQVYREHHEAGRRQGAGARRGPSTSSGEDEKGDDEQSEPKSREGSETKEFEPETADTPETADKVLAPRPAKLRRVKPKLAI